MISMSVNPAWLHLSGVQSGHICCLAVRVPQSRLFCLEVLSTSDPARPEDSSCLARLASEPQSSSFVEHSYSPHGGNILSSRG
ncbi:unnamed protein product [Protopolystoma xenopodis]|uniref:Uncharacterized protein n=1 Tax=Protopolystoma xenopodis TaxID=117903 RepID=A0A3S5CSG1_9PLAT|nr:unnamed protein product [Protopolystoma xenopodis]